MPTSAIAALASKILTGISGPLGQALQQSNTGGQANLWALGLLWGLLLFLLYGTGLLGQAPAQLHAIMPSLHSIGLGNKILGLFDPLTSLLGGAKPPHYIPTGLTPLPGSVSAVGAPHWILALGFMLWSIGIAWAILRYYSGADVVFGGGFWEGMMGGLSSMIGVILAPIIFLLAPVIVNLAGIGIYDPLVGHLYQGVVTSFGLSFHSKAGQNFLGLLENPLYILTAAVGFAGKTGIDVSKLGSLGALTMAGGVVSTVAGLTGHHGFDLVKSFLAAAFNISTLASIVHLLLTLFLVLQGSLLLFLLKFSPVWALGIVAQPTDPHKALRWLGWVGRAALGLFIIVIYDVLTVYVSVGTQFSSWVGQTAMAGISPVMWAINDLLTLTVGLALWYGITKPMIFLAFYKIPGVIAGIGGAIEEVGTMARSGGRVGGAVLGGGGTVTGGILGSAGQFLSGHGMAGLGQRLTGLGDTIGGRFSSLGEAAVAGGTALGDVATGASERMGDAARAVGNSVGRFPWMGPKSSNEHLNEFLNPLAGLAEKGWQEKGGSDGGIPEGYEGASVAPARHYQTQMPDGSTVETLEFSSKKYAPALTDYLHGAGYGDAVRMEPGVRNLLHIVPRRYNEVVRELSDAKVARKVGDLWYTAINGLRVAVPEGQPGILYLPDDQSGGRAVRVARGDRRSDPEPEAATTNG